MIALPTWFLVVVTVGVAIMAIAMVLQLGLIFGLYSAFRKLNDRMNAMMELQVQPMLNTARSILEQARRQTEQLAETLENITETTRKQVARVDQVMNEATDRARLQIIRVDEVMTDTLSRVEETTDYIQRSVVGPVHEVQAMVHGIRRAVEFLVTRGGRRPERATQDEELFI
jgi:methyl-accepting chemotaxis protein